MKSFRRISVLSAAVLLATIVSSFTVKYGAVNTSFRTVTFDLVIKGTSTIHDWEMKSNKGKCDAILALEANDKLAGITSLRFNIEAESIKSERSSMDNNAYKAMKTDKYKTVDFVLAASNVTQSDATTYQIRAIGNLTIAGATKRIDLAATAKYNAGDKSFTISGTKKLKMSEYGVKPPTLMFGTIRTGDEITIVFNTKIVK